MARRGDSVVAPVGRPIPVGLRPGGLPKPAHRAWTMLLSPIGFRTVSSGDETESMVAEVEFPDAVNGQSVALLAISRRGS